MLKLIEFLSGKLVACYRSAANAERLIFEKEQEVAKRMEEEAAKLLESSREHNAMSATLSNKADKLEQLLK